MSKLKARKFICVQCFVQIIVLLRFSCRRGEEVFVHLWEALFVSVQSLPGQRVLLTPLSTRGH